MNSDISKKVLESDPFTSRGPVTRAPVNNALVSDNSASSDSEFEDLETPKVIRTSSRNNTIHNGTFSVKSTSVKIPLKDGSTASKKPSTPFKRIAANSSPINTKNAEREDTLIREQKLISDDNKFSPQYKGRLGLLKSTENSPRRSQDVLLSPGRNRVSRFDFDALRAKSNEKPESKDKRKEDPIVRLFKPSPKKTTISDDVSSEKDDPDRLSMRPQVDVHTIRTTSPRLEKPDGVNNANTELHNIASSVDSDSILTGVIDKGSLQVAASRVDFDISQAPPKTTNQLNQLLGIDKGKVIPEEFKMGLDREFSSDEHEVSMDENSGALLNELNSYSFMSNRLFSPKKLPTPTYSFTGSKPRSAKASTPKTTSRFRTKSKAQGVNPQIQKIDGLGSTSVKNGPDMTPIGKHYDRLEHKYARHLLNKKTISEQPKPPKNRQSELGKPWSETKWGKLNQLILSPKLSVEDILNSEIVQESLDISKSDLEERIKFLIKFKEFQETQEQQVPSRKRRKLL